MSVGLKELQLNNFRNHTFFHLKELPKLTVIIGKNAIGKTNILEAIQLLTMLESFRNPQWESLLKNKEENLVIQASFLQNERTIEIRMDIENKTRKYSLNGKKRNKSEILGLIPSIIFTPDDLMLIKNSAETRRKLIDDIGQQLSSTYLKLSTDYQKIVKQRNKILKEQKQTKQNAILLESWDDSLITLGALLFSHRIRLYTRYIKKVTHFYEQITQNEVLTSQYVPSFLDERDNRTNEELTQMEKNEVEEKLAEKLKEMHNTEWVRGKTLIGPHRDEIMFFINGLEARKFASQGQQRSIALALKLGQVSLIKEVSGNQPILLLDDVLSELDENRRKTLIKSLDEQTQTIITATDLSCFCEELLQGAQVIELH